MNQKCLSTVDLETIDGPVHPAICSNGFSSCCCVVLMLLKVTICHRAVELLSVLPMTLPRCSELFLEIWVRCPLHVGCVCIIVWKRGTTPRRFGEASCVIRLGWYGNYRVGFAYPY